MLKLTAALLFSIPAVSSNAGRSLRTTNRVFQEDPTSNITCQLSALHTTYKTNDNEIVYEEETTCTLVEGGVPSLFTYPIDLPSKFAEKHERNIESSRLLVAIRGATLIAGEFVLADDAQLTVLDDNFSPSTTGRGLLEIKDARDAFGERRLIAFRVNGANGERKVLNSTSEIHRALFDNDVSVKTQYESCSINQLRWISEGVHEVFLPRAIDSYTSAQDARIAAYSEIQKSPTYIQSFGNMDVIDVAHNIIFCMPPSNYTGQKVALCQDAADKCQAAPGSASCTTAQDKCSNWKPKGFIANAQSGGPVSTYSDKWCADLSTVVHELGHNLGRGHAGKNGNAYGDSSSYMGGGGNGASATGPQKCFNGANNVEFGWYQNHLLHYNPIVNGNKMIKLVSLVDVRKAGLASVEPVIIKVGQYNIQYNQAKDYNSGVGLKNRVTIVTDTDTGGVTWIQAELTLDNNQFTFSDNGKTVFVNYCEAVAGTTTSPDAVYVGIGVGVSACTTVPQVVPSSRPTLEPSLPRPTSRPTRRPSPRPTRLPTPVPTSSPTFTPTESPTSIPTTSTTATKDPEPPSSTTFTPTESPTSIPTPSLDPEPTFRPTSSPSDRPISPPTLQPTPAPTKRPTRRPTKSPTSRPSMRPTPRPVARPTPRPVARPTPRPVARPTPRPVARPTPRPVVRPTPQQPMTMMRSNTR